MSWSRVDKEVGTRSDTPSEKEVRKLVAAAGNSIYAFIRGRGGAAIGAICIDQKGERFRFTIDQEGGK